jgi:hypothetical protein
MTTLRDPLRVGGGGVLRFAFDAPVADRWEVAADRDGWPPRCCLDIGSGLHRF